MRTLALLAALASAAACGRARELPPRAEMIATVQADVEAMVEALYAGDFESVVAKTHPDVVRASGGAGPTLELLEGAMAPILARNPRVVTFGFPEDPEFVETRHSVYALVPTLSVIEMDGQRVESLNYQFGELDEFTGEWGYVEGSRVTPDNVRQLFRDFPADVELPETDRRLR